MGNKKTRVNLEGDQGQKSLKKAIIIFAIVEALVLIPTMIYIIVR